MGPSVSEHAQIHKKEFVIEMHQNDKKSKKFVSPNRFAVLAFEEDNTIELNVRGDASDAIDESIIPTQHDNSRASSLYVHDIKNFKNTLIRLTDQNGFTCKLLPSYLIVRPQGRENFNIIAQHLNRCLFPHFHAINISALQNLHKKSAPIDPHFRHISTN